MGPVMGHVALGSGMGCSPGIVAVHARYHPATQGYRVQDVFTGSASGGVPAYRLGAGRRARVFAGAPRAIASSLGVLRGWLPAAWLGLVLGMASAAALAAPPAVLTLLDGEATVIVGNRAQQGVAGLRLPAGTLIATTPQSRLLRVEWPDGSRADLGPQTRVQLEPAGAPAVRLYLLEGAVKVTKAVADTGVLSPSFELRPFEGVVVMQQSSTRSVLFIEAGNALAGGRRGAAARIGAGQALVAEGSAAPQGPQRPPADWAAGLPRAFRDTLPSLLARWQDREPPPARLLPEADYASLQPWLVAEPLLRREFPARFAERLADPAFRNAVQRSLRRHPEWAPLLRPPPERRPAPPAPPAPTASAVPEPSR